MKNKMALRRFALRAASGYGGVSAAVDFARDLVGCFGEEVLTGGAADAAHDADIVYGHAFSTMTEGKRTKRTVAAYWTSGRVLLQVADRQAPLDAAWKDLLRACLQMAGEPRYVVLSNQRDLHLYDRATGARRGSRSRSTSCRSTLRPSSSSSTPKIIKFDKISKEVAPASWPMSTSQPAGTTRKTT